jgi:hypothetical protein
MASTIAAITTSGGGVVTTADASGNLSLLSGATTVVAVTSTGVAVTGTLAVSGVTTLTGGFTVGATAAPAFSAYLGSAQTVTAATNTKVQINTEVFDTASAFDSTTNYRFTPQVAGYYQVNAQLTGSGTVSISAIYPIIYKNGSVYQFGAISQGTGLAGGQATVISTLIYLNGSTDYIEFYGLVGGTGTITFGSSSGQQTYFSASLIRGA